MKFMISETISYDEIYSSIRQYSQDNHGKWPSYLLIHPETRRKIMISSHDENNGINYQVVQWNINSEDKYIRSNNTMFGLYLITTEDVEPGFMVVCG